MNVVIRIALRDLKNRWTLAFVMAVLFGITFASYITLITVNRSLDLTYFSLNTNQLIVQSSYGGGEIHGSRMKAEIGQLLINDGYQPIPEIHQVVGTSINNAIMLRGVQAADLTKVTPFTLVSGRNLAPGDPPRLAMIGIGLANRFETKLGDTILLRGREFEVIGIFKNGSYEDDQAWISLSDAQKLLNYDSDVSVYYIPDGGKLHEGDTLVKGISVARRGDCAYDYGKNTKNYIVYLSLIGNFVGIATIITLTNLLWRLGWLHRHDFGILRTLGFSKKTVSIYLLTQAVMILLVGIILGGTFAFAVLLSHIKGFNMSGIGLAPVWDWVSIGEISLLTFLFAAISVALPARKINSMIIPDLLGRE
jgi:ABC-type antimicrobial peptide transport system permease subunit